MQPVEVQNEENDATNLIEMLEGENDTSVNVAQNEPENLDDEIIEINGDEVIGEDDPNEQEVKIKLEETDEGNEDGEDEGSEDDEDRDDEDNEDEAELDDDDDEYEGEKGSQYKNKKERRPRKMLKKMKKQKEVLIPQMVILLNMTPVNEILTLL